MPETSQEVPVPSGTTDPRHASGAAGRDEPATRSPEIDPGSASLQRRLAALDGWEASWRRPDARYLRMSFLSTVVEGVVWTVVLAGPLVLRLLHVIAWPAWWLAVLLPAATLVWTVVDLFLLPNRVRSRGYSEREEDLLVRRGLLWHRVTAVPYGRMQYVEVTQGPWERLFGLSRVALHTASAATDVKIVGVAQEEANRLREVLAQRGEDRLAGL